MEKKIKVTVWNESRHETYPIYYEANVMKVITNAVRWAVPRTIQKIECSNTQPIENLSR